ncbi:kinesin-like protein [Encephalitozoon intestinalis ATCC 50506]|uniref:Kinesin-like protein n=1 Tax=Encephalitozoon intestinalis (strain ATCC 50506) TaxID=876142 RepID=E0S9N5_ENCIT|nr:kinesin-like protein [Encephalitozoon intestinalis ATCC 50506]ADM12420.1 kinesin-like protein [Encephalitozoon intestinalis ATCC 50506]UTX46254.1 kinesin-like protein [Encephalitozoon intestinalis]
MHSTHKKIKVSIRLRPSTGNREIWKTSEDGLWHIRGERRVKYSGFQSILSNMTNEEVYKLCVQEEVWKFLNEENCTVFAYGQTGSGKTYTMLGGDEEGIIKLAIRDVLKKRSVGISYLEIYNEKLFDLSNNNEVQMFSVGNKNVISNLWVEHVDKWEDVVPFIEKCEKNRRFGTTEFNTKSSRSHTVVQVTYSSNNRVRTLNMIDLAGSERASRSNDRRKEGSFINRSLLALCTVVNNIGNGKYLGFRNSKLTRVLQPSLDGLTNLIAICTLSPYEDCVEESVSTLKFAARLCNLELKTEEMQISSDGDGRCGGDGLEGSSRCEVKHRCCRKFHPEVSKETSDVLEKTESMTFEKYFEGYGFSEAPGLEEHREHDKVCSEKDSVAGILRTFGRVIMENLEWKVKLMEELNIINNDRIHLLERMVGELLGKNPSRRMNEIFILEKYRFNLRRKMVGRK